MTRFWAASSRVVRGAAANAITPESLVRSDDWPGFGQLATLVQCHAPHITGRGPKAAKHPEFHWVNTVPSNLKTAQSGNFHALAFKKYGPRYLAEFAYRFNRPNNLTAMLPRLLHAAVASMPHSLQKIRLPEAAG